MSDRQIRGLSPVEVLTPAEMWLRAHQWDPNMVELYKESQLEMLRAQRMREARLLSLLAVMALVSMSFLGMQIGQLLVCAVMFFAVMFVHVHDLQWQETELNVHVPEFHYWANLTEMLLPESVAQVVRQAQAHYPMASFKVLHVGNDPIVDMIVYGLPGVDGFRKTICIWDRIDGKDVIIERHPDHL